MPLIKISVPAIRAARRSSAQFIAPVFVDDDRRRLPTERPSQGHGGRAAPAGDQVSDAMATDFTSGLRRRRLHGRVERLSADKIGVRR